MLRMDLAPIRRKGATNEKLIDFLVGNTAMFSAMAQMVGMERSLSIHREIMDAVAILMNEAILPSSSEFEQLEDLFGAFRDYILACFEAEAKAGLHEFRIVENSQKGPRHRRDLLRLLRDPQAPGHRGSGRSRLLLGRGLLPGLSRALRHPLRPHPDTGSKGRPLRLSIRADAGP
jgi:hypothetical protein